MASTAQIDHCATLNTGVGDAHSAPLAAHRAPRLVGRNTVS